MVTGGGSGIGRCIAHELASLGAHVVLIGRKLDKLYDVAGEIVADGGRASFHACDIRDEETVKNTVQAMIAVHGRIDALVNNAGGQFIAPLETISGKGWEAVLNTNLTGGFLMARECYLQSMREHGGAIVNIVADMWGSMPNMGHSGAARAGMVSFTETAAIEWAQQRRARQRGGAGLHRLQRHGPLSARGRARCCARCARPCRWGASAPRRKRRRPSCSCSARRRRFISGDVLRVDGARPQVRMGWPMQVPDAEAQQRDAVKPFDGFHRAQTPEGVPGRNDGMPRLRLVLERRRARVAQQRREAMLARIAQLRALEDRAAAASAKSKPVFDKRGQLLPRERVALLLDPGAPYLPLCSLAGFLQDTQGPGAVGARRRHRGGHRLRQRRALHGGGQRLGHRRRRHPGRWGWTRSCACRRSRWRTSCPSSTWSRAPAPT